MQVVAAGDTDVVVIDFDTSRSSREDTLALLQEMDGAGAPIVVMTDDERRSTALELAQRGAFDRCCKPPHLLEFRIVIRRAFEHKQLRAELARMQEKLRGLSRFDQMIGSSFPMRTVYDLVRKVANLNTYVLVTGESGTGKELVARAIHNQSDRAGEPFVAVSCGAIPETLIEAELFGHEKGAYTSANGSREGYLEKAGAGTLLLDEIGELSLHTQVKLLRVLQERTFSRLGGSRTLPLRARVLFATHRGLDEMVSEGKFRQDLFFRVNVLKIEVPPLRERREDISDLANHFLEIYAQACAKPMRGIRHRAMDLLTAYAWPGNVRELENVIHRAVALADGPYVTAEDLPEAIQNATSEALTHDDTAGSFEELMRDYKVRLVYQAVEECNGNKSDAARRLSITRAYLHRLLRQGKHVAA